MAKGFRCECCGRQLTDPASINQGYGPECAARVLVVSGACATLANNVNTIAAGASDDAEVQRWMRVYRRAFLKKDLKSVAVFEKAAIKAARALAERRRADERRVQATVDRLVEAIGAESISETLHPLLSRFADAVRIGDELAQESFGELILARGQEARTALCVGR